MAEAKKRRGPPSKYKDEYCQQVIEHMAQGHSFVSFCAVIGVTNKTLYNWVETIDAFNAAHDIGKANRCLYYENQAKRIISGESKGNAVLTIFILKNLGKGYDYRDRTEQLIDGTLTQDIKLVPKFGEHNDESN